jgi:hypothetical protein
MRGHGGAQPTAIPEAPHDVAHLVNKHRGVIPGPLALRPKLYR